MCFVVYVRAEGAVLGLHKFVFCVTTSKNRESMGALKRAVFDVVAGEV